MASTAKSSSQNPKKRVRTTEVIAKDIDEPLLPPSEGIDGENATEARLMWEKLCITYQRLLLAKAIQEKLSDSQIRQPDAANSKLLKALNEEVLMLSFVKSQLEEAMMRHFANEITLTVPPSDQMPSILTEAAAASTTSTFPLTHLITPVTMPPTVAEMAKESMLLSALNETLDMQGVKKNDDSNALGEVVVIPNTPID